MFQDRIIAVTDAFQKMDHFYWSLQAWLMYRFDNLAACSTFLLTLIAIFSSVSPGLTAFVLNAAYHRMLGSHPVNTAICRTKTYTMSQSLRLRIRFASNTANSRWTSYQLKGWLKC